MFKHIVLGGGAYLGLYTIGALYELNKEKVIPNIKTIYGTSVGSYIGLLLCLKIDWDDLLNYFIYRPWNKTFHPNMIKNFYKDKGFLDHSIFEISLENLFLSKDLSLNTTFLELYTFSNIELHVFTTEVETMELIDISYKTHPNLKVIIGISQSCSIPYIFKPVFFNEKYYIDGGILNNFPIKNCIENGAKLEDIIGIAFKKKPLKMENIKNILSFSRFLHNKLIKIVRKKYEIKEQYSCIHIPVIQSNFEECYQLLNDSNKRDEFIKYGQKCAKEFIGGTKVPPYPLL